MFRTRKKLFLFLLFVFIIAAISVSLFVSQEQISLFTALRDSRSVSAQILFGLRLPRIFFAFLVGAGLALCGAVFQALLRNDLATPYTLGISSGSALGAVLAIKMGIDLHFYFFSTVSLFSIVGSLLTLFIIYRLVSGSRGFSTFTLILAGVTISLTFSALILFIHYLADFTETYRMVRWLMGSLDVSGWSYPSLLGLFLLLTAAFFLSKVASFNLLIAGDDFALSKGLNIARLRKQSFVIASLFVGVSVSIAGPIAFVGLIIPHVLRLLLGPDHRWIFPGALLLGGAFLIFCDTIARTIIYPAELPVGVITSLVGGPFFLFLLIQKK